jgi:hypothetical protein
LTSTYKNLNKGKGRHSRRKRYAEGKSYWLFLNYHNTYVCSFYIFIWGGGVEGHAAFRVYDNKRPC